MIEPKVRDCVLKLHRQGRAIRWIARHLQLSRATVRRIVRSRTPADPAPSTSPSILDPFKKDIDDILAEHDRTRRELGGVKELTTRSILKLLRQRGYPGGRTILDDYLRQLRGRRRLARTPYARFETPPAQECQQDWSPYRLVIGGVTRVVHLFSLILCWSRYQYLEGFPDERRDSLMYGHAAAFDFFGGVPWKILYDRQAAVTPGTVGGVPLINEQFKAFAEHYGFQIALCAPGDKERKGKVEKAFLNFENDFLGTRGRRFDSLEDFGLRLRRWLDGAEDPGEGNRRRHGTTGEVPRERWLRERDLLFKLPPTRYLPRRVHRRLLHKDCTVSVEGCRYSVPARLVAAGVRELWVSIGAGDLKVYDLEGKLVATHDLARDGQKLIVKEEHYEPLRRRQRSQRSRPLQERFAERFPDSGDFLDRLQESTRSTAPIHIKEILALLDRYGRMEIEAALRTALEHSRASAYYVRRLLERSRPSEHIGRVKHEVPRGLSLGEVDPGDSSGFGAIFETDDEKIGDRTGDQSGDQSDGTTGDKERRDDDGKDSTRS